MVLEVTAICPLWHLAIEVWHAWKSVPLGKIDTFNKKGTVWIAIDLKKKMPIEQAMMFLPV